VSGHAGGSSRGGGCGLASAAVPEKYEGQQAWKGGGSDDTSVPPAPARCWSPNKRPSHRGLDTQPMCANKNKMFIIQLEKLMLASCNCLGWVAKSVALQLAIAVPSNRVMSSQSGNVVTCTVNCCCCIAGLFMKI
jgi:hypothetical protein